MKAASEFLPRLGATLKSAVKMMLQSRCPSVRRVHASGDESIVILGNGPSLNATMDEHLQLLRRKPCMAVNFAANAPQFGTLRPRYYILVDPHFFSGKDDANLQRLWRNLASADWPMSLIVPAPCLRKARALLDAEGGRPSVSLLTVNAVGVEGFDWFTSAAYGRGWGMPRPRNVLIPAIMAALQMGYRTVYITGADHSWLKTIDVDDDNRVISVQPHFYKEDDREVRRINTEYMRYPLHQILQSFYVAFRSYHDIERYASRRGIDIYNATPGSFIDAFRRRSLLDLKK